jgi:hypothetical protein
MINVSGLGQYGVERWTSVAFGENEAVAVRPIGVFRIVPQQAEVKSTQQLNLRERSARMPAAGRSNHPDDLNPQAIRQPFQLSNGINSVDRRDIGSGAHGAESSPAAFGFPGGTNWLHNALIANQSQAGCTGKFNRNWVIG